jgi:hypothetical protein
MMMGLIALLLGGLLGGVQSDPPPAPGEEKPAAKAADEKAAAEKPAEKPVEGKPVPPKPAAGRQPLKPPALQARTGDSERAAISEADLKALHENNIFSPRRVKRQPPTGGASSNPAATEAAADRQTKPRPPLVTGFIFDPKSQCHLVVMEDRNGPAWKLFKEPKFLKPGDDVVGFHISSVERDKVVLTWDESSAVLKVGEAAPDIGFQVPDKVEPAPAGVPAKAEAEAAPLDEGTKKKVLEELRGRYKKNRASSADEP